MTSQQLMNYERALALLHRFSLENTSFRHRLFGPRWHYPSEPLRNDAARLLNEIGYQALRPEGTKRVVEPDPDRLRLQQAP